MSKIIPEKGPKITFFVVIEHLLFCSDFKNRIAVEKPHVFE